MMEIAPLAMTPVQMQAESHLGETKQAEEKKGFADYLKDSLSETNKLQLDAERENELLAAGKINDISEVVVAGAKADLALQFTLQLRNRAISAYQELMRMQV